MAWSTVVLVVALSILAPVSAAALEAPKLPARVNEAVSKAIKHLNSAYVSGDYGGNLQETAAKGYRHAMDELSALATEKLCKELVPFEGTCFKAKLILIAHDRKVNHEAHEELRKAYLVLNRFARARGLRPEHAIEKYRLAWEYYLLKPMERFDSGLVDMNASLALGMIKNPLSLITIREAFKQMCVQGIDSNFIYTRQTYISNAWGHFVSREGLEVILEGVELSTKFRKRLTADKNRQVFDAENDASQTLAPTVDHAYAKESKEVVRRRWEKVVKDYPLKGLTASQRRVLTKALESYRVGLPPETPSR